MDEKKLQDTFDRIKTGKLVLKSPQEFLKFYDEVELEMNLSEDFTYFDYCDDLFEKSSGCSQLIKETDECLDALLLLTKQYTFVSNQTSALHSASEKLLQDQMKLSELANEIKRRLNYFVRVESIHQRLQNPTFSVAGDTFSELLKHIDESLEMIRQNPKYKESLTYNIKFKQCLSKAIQMMKTYVIQALSAATEQVLTPRLDTVASQDGSSDVAFALYYGKFQASSVKVKRITTLLEERLTNGVQEYAQLLSELQQFYLSQRAQIMSSGVESAIKNLTVKHKGDHCALVRSSCAFLVHVCHDEQRLFHQFFSVASEQLISYMEGICTILYDTLRPFVIHINHLETLAEICSILRIEMMEEHVQNDPEVLEAFGRIVNQLLQDVQERLVFRAHLYLESDILNYHPSPGDLAYPEKLEMMESIALSLQQEQPQLRRSDSRGSIASVTTIGDSASVMAEQVFRSKTGSSPADLHGMWYPPVRRTLVCLSRLYRCIDRPIFQGLSQEALSYCIVSVSSAGQQIAAKKTAIDGELFEIKHLLILREQIAPFRVDFTVRETSLDFSKVKTAAFELIQKRSRLFSIGSSNALLEFLLDGTPQVKEQLVDSRKDVDRQLKHVCEVFIRDVSKLLIGPVLGFIENAHNILKTTGTSTTPQTQPSKASFTLRQSPWASPQQISSLIQESQRNIKSKLAGVQRAMQLYLANKDTEFILFRPIRNNVIGAFVKLEQILMANCYTKDDLTICGCPSAEQVSVLVSNASLAADSLQQLSRKISTSSNEGQRKISIDRAPSFDGNQNTEEQGSSSLTVAQDTLVEVSEVSSPDESPNRNFKNLESKEDPPIVSSTEDNEGNSSSVTEGAGVSNV